MPLVRRDPPAPAGPPGPAPASLEAAEPASRLAAARALAGRPEGAAALGAALAGEADARVREALLSALVAIADEAAAAALAPHLRAQDPALRNGCVEALQDMPAAVAGLLPGLLGDPDPDVRLLAAGIARSQAPEAATALLVRLLESEPHPNVCAAAVEVLAEVGTAGARASLRAARARFAADPFLPLAIDATLARLGGEG
ncbi:hypothetical protein OPKNFCMD_1676 [Methylobacterium crusticola]|uniref:HEAT repeat domain-containing protein n=2 Tax=Methylobacterium crusticola TaxID=1697972 RepID=A0ABQ4QVM9_9HYPH|nr:HEAT repeat domain-containing protein [Methylobacterium crusticola]GJD48950.1 hypothetical protein OPKNFCMD_1676 [Methylobacterium crusticola]